MQSYDDFALSIESFEAMAREYQKYHDKVSGLRVKCNEIDSNDIKMLFNKIEYLRVLVSNLSDHTSNIDALKVIEDVALVITDQSKKLSDILKPIATTSSMEETDIKIFCNNLKLAINTAGEIVKLLVKIKDQDDSFELSPQLTSAVSEFIDINNQLVSLFGECRYRAFAIYKK